MHRPKPKRRSKKIIRLFPSKGAKQRKAERNFLLGLKWLNKNLGSAFANRIVAIAKKIGPFLQIDLHPKEQIVITFNGPRTGFDIRIENDCIVVNSSAFPPTIEKKLARAKQENAEKFFETLVGALEKEYPFNPKKIGDWKNALRFAIEEGLSEIEAELKNP